MPALALKTPPTLVTTYLQLTDPAQFRPAFLDDARLSIRQMMPPDVPLYRLLYTKIGREWRWRDRLLLDDDQLYAVLALPTTAVYVLVVDAAPAGYIELAAQDKDMEIAYFGLLTEYMGSGYGKHLLSYGVAQAWTAGARRVWVHTCNLDSPQAMNTYVKRGFSVYRIDEQSMPARYK